MAGKYLGEGVAEKKQTKHAWFAFLKRGEGFPLKKIRIENFINSIYDYSNNS
jgi:hypothetical protein